MHYTPVHIPLLLMRHHPTMTNLQQYNYLKKYGNELRFFLNQRLVGRCYFVGNEDLRAFSEEFSHMSEIGEQRLLGEIRAVNKRIKALAEKTREERRTIENARNLRERQLRKQQHVVVNISQKEFRAFP